MKLRVILISTIILCVVNDGNCGVISDVYGNVRNKTVAITSGVTSWLSHGKDWVLGTKDRHLTPILKRGDEVPVDDGLISKIYNSLLSGYQNTRDKVYGFFISDDKRENNGFISNMYDKVKNRITMITAYVVGEENMDQSKEAEDLSEIRRALNTVINKQKSLQEEHLQEAVEVLKDKTETVQNTAKGKIDEIKNLAEERISGGINSAKDSFTSTLDHLQQSGIEISEKEREVLNAISNRLRERVSSVKNVVEDEKQLVNAEGEKREK